MSLNLIGAVSGERAVAAQTSLLVRDRVVHLKRNFFVLDRSPQPVNEHIVTPGAGHGTPHALLVRKLYTSRKNGEVRQQDTVVRRSICD